MQDPSTRRRPGWRLPLRLLGALLLSLLAAEVAVRLAASRLPAVRLLAAPAGTRVADPTSFEEFRQAFADHLVPGRIWFDFRCNSLGFHDLEFSPSLPPGGFRIVALGDSFAYGSVPYGGAYLTLVEALLALSRGAGRAEAPPLEIDNLGVPASGVADYRLVYDFVGRGLDPDLVLLTLYLGNDPLDFQDASRFGRPRRGPRSWLATFLSRSFRLALERWRGAAVASRSEPLPTAAARPARVYTDDSPELAREVFSAAAFAEIMRGELRVLAPPGSDLGPPDWEAFLASLDGLVRQIQDDGRPLAIVLAPSRLQVYPEEMRRAASAASADAADLDPDLPNRRIAAWASARGLPLVDLTPHLRRVAADAGRLYKRNDTHWSLRGNSVAAVEVARRLVATGLVAGATEGPAWAAAAQNQETSLLPPPGSF